MNFKMLITRIASLLLAIFILIGVYSFILGMLGLYNPGCPDSSTTGIAFRTDIEKPDQFTIEQVQNFEFHPTKFYFEYWIWNHDFISKNIENISFRVSQEQGPEEDPYTIWTYIQDVVPINIGSGGFNYNEVSWNGTFDEQIPGVLPIPGKITVRIGFTDFSNQWSEWIDEFDIDIVDENNPTTEPSIEIIEITGAADPFLYIDTRVTNIEEPGEVTISYLIDQAPEGCDWGNPMILDQYWGDFCPTDMEWGGSLEGTVTINAYLFWKEDGVQKEKRSTSKTVECSGVYIDKNIGVEYDYQEDYAIPELGNAKQDNAFAAAGIELGFTLHEILVPEYIIWYEDYDELIRDYISSNKNTDKNAYICGIMGVGIDLDNDGDVDVPNTSVAGITHSGWGSESGSLICMDIIGNNQQEFLAKVIIHELGHHIGQLDHDHAYFKPYCCMNQGYYSSYTSNVGDDNWGYGGKIYICKNPHFCEYCVDNLNIFKYNFSE